MTTGKTIALTRRTLVSKIMSLLLNMLSRLVITFLPRSKHLLISWLQSPSAVIFVSNSLQPHRRQPHCPGDLPGKNTGVSCHFLLQKEVKVPQSCLTLCDPMDCSLPGSSIHGIFQARVLEWVAIAFSILSIGESNCLYNFSLSISSNQSKIL